MAQGGAPQARSHRPTGFALIAVRAGEWMALKWCNWGVKKVQICSD